MKDIYVEPKSYFTEEMLEILEGKKESQREIEQQQSKESEED